MRWDDAWRRVPALASVGGLELLLTRGRSREVAEMRYVRTGALLCLTALAAAACSGGSVRNVTVATASRGTITTDAGGLGTVAAGVDVPLALSFTDQVQDVSVEPGQHVSKGQALLTLDPRPLLANVSQLQAHLGRANADLAHVQAVQQRTAPPLVPGLQEQEQTLAGQVRIYSQLLATAQGQSSTVTSPIDGEVLAVNVRPGEVAKTGHTLVEIVNYQRITVTAELPVSAQSEVTPGDAARLSFAAAPGLTLTGTVSGASPGAVNHGTGFQVAIDAPNTTGQRIRPGYQAYVQVPYSHHAGTIVRRMAVLNIDQDPAMFVVSGSVVQLRRVQVGARGTSNVEILSGIKPGEEYVLVGNENLADGDHVRITGDLGAPGGRSR